LGAAAAVPLACRRRSGRRLKEFPLRLSLCIPTFNRAPQLRQLLASVARQADHGLDVEVVISDNASDDDTPAVIAEFASGGMAIVYKRLPENLGFDRNMLHVVSMASSDYCWLFGSDDIVEDGAFARIERLFAAHPTPTGISVGSNGYRSDLSERIYLRDHISIEFAGETVLHGRDSIIKGVGPWGLGFISSILIRRQAWSDAVAASPVEEYHNGYVHIYVLARALDANSTWICIPDRLVGWRSGNDSAVSKDEFKRTRLDIVGFDESFGGALGRDNAAYHETMRKVATFYIRSHFLVAKVSGVSNRYWRQAIPMSLARYWRYPSFWTKTLPIALTPRFALLLARKAYKSTLKGAHQKIGDL
jgi:abequosyltransferase